MGAAVVGIVIALAVVVWCVGGFAVARAVGGAFASGAGRAPEKDPLHAVPADTRVKSL